MFQIFSHKEQKIKEFTALCNLKARLYPKWHAP